MKYNALTKEAIEAKGGIVPENVVDAMKEYPNEMLCRTAEAHERLLRELLELNGEENSFADLYYGRLEVGEQQTILEALSGEDKAVLQEHAFDEGIYFKLTAENLPLLAKLSAEELLFCTYYFTKYPCTIWGNYELSYPIFYKNEEVKIWLEERDIL